MLDSGIRDELRPLLSTSGSMAGLCITGVTLFSTVGHGIRESTVADDILVVCALFFMFCTLSVFAALRAKHRALAINLARGAESLFALALIGMVSAGFIMMYTLW